MEIKLLGHSSLYIEFCQQKIWVDPCLQDDYLGIFRRFPDMGEFDFQLPDPDYVFLTHHHWDVICIRTLLLVNKDVKVLIPQNEQLIQILKLLGFINIQIMEPWQEQKIADGRLITIPSEVSFGELGFLLKDDHSSFLNLADNRLTGSTIDRINRNF
ncbi:MBL fold metallo-hydrolase, partial [bacterium]|nr:MBL fold metallo-hydrolase [bacterium]